MQETTNEPSALDLELNELGFTSVEKLSGNLNAIRCKRCKNGEGFDVAWPDMAQDQGYIDTLRKKALASAKAHRCSDNFGGDPT